MNFFNFFKKTPKLNTARVDTLIDEHTKITGGVIQYSGSLLVNGEVDAKIEMLQNKKIDSYTVIVGETGSILTTELVADYIIIRGTVKGDVTARQLLRIEKAGSIIGNVAYNEINIEIGGVISGKICYNPELASGQEHTPEPQ